MIVVYLKIEEKYEADAKRIYLKEYNWGAMLIDYAMKIALDFIVWRK